MKPIIAIVHTGNNGDAYELIFRTFSTPEMLDICTPVIYGSSAEAKSCVDSLGVEVHFSVVPSAKDAMHGRINIIETESDKVKSAVDADFNDGLFLALVSIPAKNDMWKTEEYFDIFLNQRIRQVVSSGKLETEIEALDKSLKQDFRIIQPRIAVVSSETEDVKAAINSAREKKILAYGPYSVDDFVANAYFENFDAVFTIDENQSVEKLQNVSIGASCVYTAGIPMVKTSAEDLDSFRQSVYSAIDIARNRKNYLEPYANPLPKLFHEKKDDGERLRFNIPAKKKEEQAKE